MQWVLTGRVVYKFGDNFMTDLITEYPRYKSISDPEGLAKICMIGIDPEFPKKVQGGGIIVGGKNFGYGHPHLQAHKALRAVGISAVVAESYSGKWQRVAVNSGLPALQVPSVTKTVSTNDSISVNLETGEVRNLTTGATTVGKPLPDFMRATIELGGPIQYIKQRVATMKSQSKEYEKAVSG